MCPTYRMIGQFPDFGLSCAQIWLGERVVTGLHPTGIIIVGSHKPDGAPRKRGDAELSALDFS